MTDAIRVMLVDDQELIRSGFRLLLMAEPDISVVAEAASGEEALEKLAALAGAPSVSADEDAGCDVILMDVRMPGITGIEATEQVVERFPRARVLVLTTFDGDQYVASAVRAGAGGFLLKDATPEELVRAIERVHAGEAVMAQSVTNRVWQQLRGEAAPAEPSEQNAATAVAVAQAHSGETEKPRQTDAYGHAFDSLTGRELEVLRLIAYGKNNSEICSELFLSESTVKTHISRIFAKLGVRDRVHAVIFAKDCGL
jgi:DNA-binding NarL/FixJ family response regulator